MVLLVMRSTESLKTVLLTEMLTALSMVGSQMSVDLLDKVIMPM